MTSHPKDRKLIYSLPTIIACQMAALEEVWIAKLFGGQAKFVCQAVLVLKVPIWG
jgi:hypothetical protein